MNTSKTYKTSRRSGAKTCAQAQDDSRIDFPFEVGDVVMLNSGGQYMTVEIINHDDDRQTSETIIGVVFSNVHASLARDFFDWRMLKKPDTDEEIPF